VIAEQGHGPGILQQVPDFRGLPPAVDRTGDAADFDDSKIYVVKFRAVIHEQTDPVALSDPQLQKAVGYAVALVIQVTVRDIPVVKADGDPVLTAATLCFHHFPDVRKRSIHVRLLAGLKPFLRALSNDGCGMTPFAAFYGIRRPAPLPLPVTGS